jgi:hypothetical protein
LTALSVSITGDLTKGCHVARNERSRERNGLWRRERPVARRGVRVSGSYRRDRRSEVERRARRKKEGEVRGEVKRVESVVR